MCKIIAVAQTSENEYASILSMVLLQMKAVM